VLKGLNAFGSPVLGEEIKGFIGKFFGAGVRNAI
jgi:hypothetical protein